VKVREQSAAATGDRVKNQDRIVLTGESQTFSKNEATDLLDNKGSTLGGIRNEPTVDGRRQESGWSRRVPLTLRIHAGMRPPNKVL
jgi:hypothetical protein